MAGAIGVWLLFFNALSVVAFWYDKNQARKGGWRMSEANLLLIALIGGWPGAKYAQHRFRHKTKKQPFGHELDFIGFLWLAFFAAAILMPETLFWPLVDRVAF